MLPSGMPVFLYHGRADEVVPFTTVEMYAQVLPQAIVRRLDGRKWQATSASCGESAAGAIARGSPELKRARA